MTYYSDEVYEIERDGLVFKMRLEVEEYPDTSWIGEYTNKDDAFIVDRRHGFLYGDWEEEPFEPDPQDYATEDEYDEAMVDYALVYDEWNDKGRREILAEVSNRYQWGEYRYFKPCAGGENEPGGKYTDQEGIEHTISVEEWTKWAVQDYERVESMNRGDWCFVGVVVEIDAPVCSRCGHVERLTASLWGIASDSDDSYFEEVRDDLIRELQHDLVKYQETV